MKKFVGVVLGLLGVLAFWRRRQSTPTSTERIRARSVDLAETGKSRGARVLAAVRRLIRRG
ncbi:MAG: hypothetical protein O3A10_01930 [Chloroflexi bacterium]|nr:hypothetical protein [Chloroflexota bacterium]MDA1146893.1 hypothetical protein [Chloroflexota bacterium]